jgi:hypothetical protein
METARIKAIFLTADNTDANGIRDRGLRFTDVSSDASQCHLRRGRSRRARGPHPTSAGYAHYWPWQTVRNPDDSHYNSRAMGSKRTWFVSWKIKS